MGREVVVGKYSPLTDHLNRQKSDLVAMSFAEVEHVLGGKLPSSAQTHRAWWSNNPDNNVTTRAWLDAGYQSEQVDLAGKKLVFRRVGGSGVSIEPLPGSAARAGGDTKPALFGWLRGTVTIAPGTDLTRPAALRSPGRIDDGSHAPSA